MPLTKFQSKVARLLAPQRSPDSHLAGGAALHHAPNSTRYSNDLDYFHDSVQRVGEAFSADEALLKKEGFDVAIEMNQPGYIRAIVSQKENTTKVEWSHDTAWRFMPTVEVEGIGYQLAPIDLAINKVLALAGRDEPRDFLDILYVLEHILPLGALCWAAVGKDPGFTPESLLSLIRRRGKYRQEEFDRLHLVKPVNVVDLKQQWLEALAEAEGFIGKQPAEEFGCLYYSSEKDDFVSPSRGPDGSLENGVAPHYGRPGGVLPQVG